VLDPEMQGYSEYTPGSSASWDCIKGHWVDNPLMLQKDDFLKLIETAKTCKDYEHYRKE